MQNPIHNMNKSSLSLLLFEAKSVARGIQQPRVIVGAFHAGVQPQGLSGQFSGGQRARVGQGAIGLALHVALLLPFGVIPQRINVHWILHPLNDLKHMSWMQVLMLWGNLSWE